MKLDYKKTFYVGLAFFIITIFWQTYDSIITKILIDKFGLNQTWSGVVMALDNVLALFMLPLFGACDCGYCGCSVCIYWIILC